MSCLTADENGLYQRSHASLTEQLRIIPPVGEGAREVMSSIIFALLASRRKKTRGLTSIICYGDNKSCRFKVLSGALVGDERDFHLGAGGQTDEGVESIKDTNR